MKPENIKEKALILLFHLGVEVFSSGWGQCKSASGAPAYLLLTAKDGAWGTPLIAFIKGSYDNSRPSNNQTCLLNIKEADHLELPWFPRALKWPLGTGDQHRRQNIVSNTGFANLNWLRETDHKMVFQSVTLVSHLVKYTGNLINNGMKLLKKSVDYYL